MKLLWKGIKDIISLKPNNTDTFSHLVDDNGLKISNSVHIANEFNEYFTKVAEGITKKSQEPKNLLYHIYCIQTQLLFSSLHVQLMRYLM